MFDPAGFPLPELVGKKGNVQVHLWLAASMEKSQLRLGMLGSALSLWQPLPTGTRGSSTDPAAPAEQQGDQLQIFF